MPAVLVICLLLVPLAEIYVIVQVGQVIGGWWTLLLLVLESMFGAWVVRREGVRAWRALRESLRHGGLPSRELLDAALVLIGGTLLLTPGFLTDIAGFLLVLPLTRPLLRGLVVRTLTRRVLRTAGIPGAAGGLFGGPAAGPARPSPGPGRSHGDVIPGEVVRDDEPRR